MYNPMQMRYAEPDFKNERDDNDPDLIGFLRVEGSAMCEVSFYNIKLWKAYDKTYTMLSFNVISDANVWHFLTGTPRRGHGDDNMGVDNTIVLSTSHTLTISVSQVSLSK